MYVLAAFSTADLNTVKITLEEILCCFFLLYRCFRRLSSCDCVDLTDPASWLAPVQLGRSTVQGIHRAQHNDDGTAMEVVHCFQMALKRQRNLVELCSSEEAVRVAQQNAAESSAAGSSSVATGVAVGAPKPAAAAAVAREAWI